MQKYHYIRQITIIVAEYTMEINFKMNEMNRKKKKKTVENLIYIYRRLEHSTVNEEKETIK
jgi:hypothetical protein